MGKTRRPEPDDMDFEDDIARAFAELGITRRPGMAQDLLHQLGPLLKDEGVDLDSGELPDQDTLEAALQRAVERHNMELNTPTGAHRRQTLAVLRRVAELTALGDQDGVSTTLRLLRPDETEHRPAVSHVIGVSVGLLDTWSGARRTRSALARLGDAPAVRHSPAAHDIVSAARQGQAFDSLHHLTLAHGGLELMHGATTAVAAAVREIARATHASVPAVCADLLIGDDEYATLLATPLTGGGGTAPQATGSSFFAPTPGAAAGRRPASAPLPPMARRGDADDRALLKEFGQWLRTSTGSAPSAPEVADEVTALRRSLEALRAAGGDRDDPDQVAGLVDTLLDIAEEGDEHTAANAQAGISALADYVLFRFDTSEGLEQDEWGILQDDMSSLTLRLQLDNLADTTDADLPEDVRLTAQADTPACRAVVEFLGWLGEGRPVTDSRRLRLPDIQPVAAMLGLDVEGTRQRRDAGEGGTPLRPGRLRVRSMSEVPVLRDWWRVMELTDIITFIGTRVRPGRLAPEWSATPLTNTRLVSGFLAACVADVLLTDSGGDDQGAEQSAIDRAVELLGPALVRGLPDEDGSAIDLLVPTSGPAWQDLLSESAIAREVERRARRKVDDLVTLGLVEQVEGTYRVPEVMGPPVARGLSFAISTLADPTVGLPEGSTLD